MRYIKKLSVLFVLILCFSCKKDDAPEPIDNSMLTLLKSENKVLRNQAVAFQLMDEQTDMTQSATFYVNGSAIDGNVFSSSVEGSFQVYAEYNGTGRLENTQTDSFDVYIPRKKILIEGFTGAWCGNCPNLDFAIEKARDSIEYLVVVMIHGGREYVGSQDPFTIPEGMILFESLEVLGYPTGIIDRTVRWTYSIIPPFPLEDLIPYSGLDADVSIGVDSELTSENLSVDVKIISEQAISNSKLVVFLLEDGLFYDQVNYGNDRPEDPYYQMGNPIVDFEHNDVLRMSITDPLGDLVPETSPLTEYSRNFNVAIPSEFNPSNLKLVVTLLDEDNKVRNTQEIPINQFQDYE